MSSSDAFDEETSRGVVRATAEDEPKVTEYDTLVGGGDCGETLLNGVDG